MHTMLASSYEGLGSFLFVLAGLALGGGIVGFALIEFRFLISGAIVSTLATLLCGVMLFLLSDFWHSYNICMMALVIVAIFNLLVSGYGFTKLLKR